MWRRLDSSNRSNATRGRIVGTLVLRPTTSALLGCLALAILVMPPELQGQYDVVILGGRVMDGSGNPWRYADVAIQGDQIVGVGDYTSASARRVIDATGKVVAPGFIDIHSHAAGPKYGRRGLRSDDARRRAAPNLVMQGITTVVGNQDGRSMWPIAGQRAELESNPFGPNVILMVGHGTVRREVMGDDFRRPATDEEIRRMAALVRQGMEEGAMGMTAGLEYVPGRWSETKEVIAMVAEIVPFNGAYVSHERSEGADPMWYWPSEFSGRPPSLMDAVMETIEIGEATGARVVASHIKAKGANYWGASSTVIRMINEARDRGVQIYADQYPYATTGSDGSTVMIPGWAIGAGGRGRRVEGEGRPDFAAELRKVLENDSLTAVLENDIEHEVYRRGGPMRVIIMEADNPDWVGKSVGELAAARGIAPVDMAIALQLEGNPTRRGGVGTRGLSLSEYDIEPYAAQEWTITATDGWVTLPEDGLTHPRVYGTFPRKIAYYAKERGVLSVEAAIRSSTSLPGDVMGLTDRGWLRAGYKADIVVFDLETIKDNATIFEPHQYSDGIEFVLINGQFVVESGEPTWAMPGKVLVRDEETASSTGAGEN